jgi:GntR family transcriptional regulator, histidine utilization repressor
MSALPRYQQLKQQIIGQISRGELKPRDRVPSENDLVGSAGVSRMTANRALRELNDEGYVERVAGVGTFVADLHRTARSPALGDRDHAAERACRG